MQRIACEERPDWRHVAESMGFVFHTLDGKPYWDETAYYSFTLEEIERGIEQPTAELEAMCLEVVDRAVADDAVLQRLQIPVRYWNWIVRSWRKREPSLYGRFDLRYDGTEPAKLLEYNADTPTALFETAVFQWAWLEDAIGRKVVAAGADQFNSLHEHLIERWKAIGCGRVLHLTGLLDDLEDAGTLAYMEDCARQAGLSTRMLGIETIGRRSDGVFVDQDDMPIELMFKLYPWEWMMREPFGASLPGAPCQFVEPAWKAILSNKGILALLWEMFPGHPNLLPAAFENEGASASLGQSYVRKPLYSREGGNVEIILDGKADQSADGPYGAEGFVRQAVAPLPRFGLHHVVLGSWIVASRPCGLCVREDAGTITRNTSRFLPHAIIG
jgi:glutathionylspermidine synthase